MLRRPKRSKIEVASPKEEEEEEEEVNCAISKTLSCLKTSSIVGWLTSIRQRGEILVIPTGRLGN
jgi:hypothetical protein